MNDPVTHIRDLRDYIRRVNGPNPPSAWGCYHVTDRPSLATVHRPVIAQRSYPGHIPLLDFAPAVLEWLRRKDIPVDLILGTQQTTDRMLSYQIGSDANSVHCLLVRADHIGPDTRAKIQLATLFYPRRLRKLWANAEYERTIDQSLHEEAQESLHRNMDVTTTVLFDALDSAAKGTQTDGREEYGL